MPKPVKQQQQQVQPKDDEMAAQVTHREDGHLPYFSPRGLSGLKFRNCSMNCVSVSRA